MSLSAAVFSAAQKFPWFFRPLTRFILSNFPYQNRQPHWVLLELKERLDIRIARRMAVDGFTVEADPFDGPGNTFWRSGLTEPETRDLVGRLLKPGMVMFDIGAYVGQFSLVASRATEGKARIYAVEPTPNVFRQLQRNMMANNCPQVTCVQAAVSDKPGRQKFYFYPCSQDQNSLAPLADKDARSVEVDVETLSSLADKYALTRLDLVKIDVEGYERWVLEGASAALRKFRPTLIIEISRHQRKLGYSGEQIKEILDSLHYAVYRVGATTVPYFPTDEEINFTTSHFNILAVPR